MTTTLQYVRVDGRPDLPRSVEGGQGTGYLYMVPGEGYVSQSGYYSGTWSAWTLTGTFVGEFNSRKAAAEDLIAYNGRNR